MEEELEDAVAANVLHRRIGEAETARCRLEARCQVYEQRIAELEAELESRPAKAKRPSS